VGNVIWLAQLLRACHSALERAEHPEFPAPAGFIADLRRYTQDVEREIEAAREAPEGASIADRL